MTRQPRPLGKSSRRVLLVVAIAWTRHQRAPTFSEIIRTVGLADEGRARFVSRMEGLRRRGLVTFRDNEARSVTLTPAGYRSAIGRGVR